MLAAAAAAEAATDVFISMQFEDDSALRKAKLLVCSVQVAVVAAMLTMTRCAISRKQCCKFNTHYRLTASYR